MDLRQITLAAAAGLAVSALAACSVSPDAVPATGSGASSAVSTPVAAAAQKAPYCKRAPSGMVGAALGLAVGRQVTSLDGPVSVCAYQGKYEVLVRFQVGENASEFSQSQTSMTSLHQTVSRVSGLGDQAYYARYGAGARASNTLAARKGAVAVFVTAPVTLRAERSLMTELLAKL